MGRTYNGGKNEAVGSNMALGSWLIPAEGFQDTEAVAKVFKEVGPSLDPKEVWFLPRPFRFSLRGRCRDN